MSFDSVIYIVFLPTFTLIHRMCPHKARWAVLLAASIIFYMSWNIPLTLLLVTVIAVTYFSGFLLHKIEKTGFRRIVLCASLIICIFLLAYFKYFNFIIAGINSIAGIFGAAKTFELLDIILPVGISFYTFQALSYVIDVYREPAKYEKHPGYYALYVSFFPQLVAGPIERADSLIPQLKAERSITSEDVKCALSLIISGFFRKIVVADCCGVFVDRVFSSSAPDGSAVFISSVLFAMQIYCDFAGYSEIARGSAKLFGIDLMVNFDRPYAALSIRDFWKRWHISLNRWFTDYVYIPLGGNRYGAFRQILAVMAVFILSGLWHGAKWTFVLWGLIHGILVSVEITVFRKINQEKLPRWTSLPRWILTFSLVCFSWIFFRSSSVSDAFSFISALFSAWNIPEGWNLLGAGVTDVLWILSGVAGCALLHRITDKDHATHPLSYAYLLCAVIIGWILRYRMHLDSAFIYFQF